MPIEPPSAGNLPSSPSNRPSNELPTPPLTPGNELPSGPSRPDQDLPPRGFDFERQRNHLRDEFAKAALGGLCASNVSTMELSDVAKQAFDLADAMLVQRDAE